MHAILGRQEAIERVYWRNCSHLIYTRECPVRWLQCKVIKCSKEAVRRTSVCTGAMAAGWQVDFKDAKAQQNLAMHWVRCEETIQEQNPVSVLVTEWALKPFPGPRKSPSGGKTVCARSVWKDLCDGQVHSWVVKLQGRDLSYRERW